MIFRKFHKTALRECRNSIGRIEDKLSRIDADITILKCSHKVTNLERYISGLYREVCTDCGKAIRTMTESEFLDESIKRTEEKLGIYENRKKELGGRNETRSNK